MDEARFGTHSKIGHGWYKTGERNRVNVKLGFKNFYVYTSAEPTSGESFSLLLPKVNTDSMNIFLTEMSKCYKDEKIVMIMDGAGWHKSKKLIEHKNIKIIYLPPYCPEFNPVERLWLYIKANTIRNKFYDSLDELEDAVCNFMNTIAPHTISKICNVNWFN